MNPELDARGLKCPLPVLKAKKALRSLAAGTDLDVLVTDPGAPEDFVHFCRTTGTRLVACEAVGDHWRITLGGPEAGAG